jgi:hypothetical protein
MRFQIVRTRPGFGVEERLQVYSDKHNADLWLTDQGAVTNPEGTTVLVAEESGVIWNYHVEEIGDLEESPAPEPSTTSTKPRSSQRRRPATSRANKAGRPSR